LDHRAGHVLEGGGDGRAAEQLRRGRCGASGNPCPAGYLWHPGLGGGRAGCAAGYRVSTAGADQAACRTLATGGKCMSMKQLKVDNLFHKYGIVEVLNNISLSVSSGQTLALVGPS